MKITKIQIKNLFGIKQIELDGRDVELTGKKGSGKTSVIDAIRYALTNASDRDYVVRNGATEGEIVIETDTGLVIDRKKRTDKVDYKSVKEFGREVDKPQSFLNDIFTPMQLDPVAFCRMSRQEQNRTILDLIEFDWDMSTIEGWFGEIPKQIDYSQNILQILADIQAEKGVYFQTRQDINRDIRNKNAMINDVARDIPQGYDAAKWESFDLGATYKEIERIKRDNAIIDRAKAFKQNYANQCRAIEADKQIEIAAAERTIATQRNDLTGLIERLKAEIAAAQDKIAGLDDILKDKVALAESSAAEKLAKLVGAAQEADKYADRKPDDTSELEAEVANAERMKKHLNEYRRMRAYQVEVEALKAESDEYTRKIELARELPAKILETATLPIEGMTVENGVPLIHGLPVSNLSDGEKIALTVEITIARQGALKMILLNNAEALDDQSRAELYKKCKDNGVTIIAARTTNDNELEVVEL